MRLYNRLVQLIVLFDQQGFSYQHEKVLLIKLAC